MAKVIIELEDEGDKVQVGISPSAAELMQKHYGTVAGLTSAESYGLFVVNQLNKTSAEQKIAASPLAIPGKLKPY